MRDKVFAAFLQIFILFLFGCSYDDTASVQVDFIKVVGQYDGNSATCEITSPSNDSICTPSIPNNLKIILYDLNTIIVTDERNLFQQNRFVYTDTEIISNKRVHNCIASDTTNTSLTYDEFLKKISILSLEFAAGKKLSKSFTGIKK